MIPNSINHVIVYFGIIKSGAIPISLNVMFKEEVLIRLKDVEAKTVVF